MADYFFDSSALLKRYLAENGSDRVLDIVGGGRPIAVSRLAAVEVVSACVRRCKARDIDPQDLDRISEAAEDDFRELFQVVEVTQAIMMRSIDIVRKHALRAADAIHLASALRDATADGSKPVLVSSDLELNAAARSEGLTVLDPQRE